MSDDDTSQWVRERGAVNNMPGRVGRCHMAVLVEPDQESEIPHRDSTLVHADQIADMLQIRVESSAPVPDGSDVGSLSILSHVIS